MLTTSSIVARQRGHGGALPPRLLLISSDTTGRDAKGRKQYRYHARFREVRESTKYEHVVAFADALPAIREKVREHMALRGLPREKVVATVVHLLETTLIRVGNDDYAKQNNSYGLTTLKNRHEETRCVSAPPVKAVSNGRCVRDQRIAKIIKRARICPDRNCSSTWTKRAISRTSRRPM